MSQINISVDAAELATILAALRFYQRAEQGEPANRSDDIHLIATDGDSQIADFEELVQLQDRRLFLFRQDGRRTVAA